MRRLAPVLLLTVFLPTCGGDDNPAKDWSNSPMAERAVDYCLKLAACSPDVDLLSISRCVDTMADLSKFSNQVPTRRQLQELVVLRECYNKAKSCSAVRECVGIPSGGSDLDRCDLDNAANSCAQRMGVSTLRRCVPAPDGEGGVWLEIDCTKYGLVCGFNEQNINLCVSDTCSPAEDPPICEESTGDLEVCGGVDPVTGQSVGAIINEYACSYLGMGCDIGPGPTADPLDDAPQCIGTGEDCDPAQVGFTCEGSVLSLCQPNVDPTTGNLASWDCATGVIHHECNAGLGLCTKSASVCDPTTDRGSCDGTDLTVCVDGTPYTTDCRLHGIGDCGADTNGDFTCLD